jgi:hypothetical protein
VQNLKIVNEAPEYDMNTLLDSDIVTCERPTVEGLLHDMDEDDLYEEEVPVGIVAHAEFYIFAEDHKNEDMKQFARQKLVMLLSDADGAHGKVCDAAREAYELLENYDNNFTPELACESMKEVLVYFAALNLEYFSSEVHDRKGELWGNAMKKVTQWRDTEKSLLQGESA